MHARPLVAHRAAQTHRRPDPPAQALRIASRRRRAFCGTRVATSDDTQELAMEEVKVVRVPNPNATHLAGTLWFGGWLFTIGFAKLVWWKVLLALAAWPYFLALAIHQ
jgi:hypothetical protein